MNNVLGRIEETLRSLGRKWKLAISFDFQETVVLAQGKLFF